MLIREQLEITKCQLLLLLHLLFGRNKLLLASIRWRARQKNVVFKEITSSDHSIQTKMRTAIIAVPLYQDRILTPGKNVKNTSFNESYRSLYIFLQILFISLHFFLILFSSTFSI